VNETWYGKVKSKVKSKFSKSKEAPNQPTNANKSSKRPQNPVSRSKLSETIEASPVLSRSERFLRRFRPTYPTDPFSPKFSGDRL
jgi:hypothetical protein